MVDNVNPTSQFHPYQPQDKVPVADMPPTGFSGILNRLGIDRSRIDAIGRSVSGGSVGSQLSKARGVARSNPGMVLGGLAALAIGAGLLRKRSR